MAMISERDGKHYIPVALAWRERDKILVELPAEADSGAQRVWVSPDSLVEEQPA
jgi:hypothetical protein